MNRFYSDILYILDDLIKSQKKNPIKKTGSRPVSAKGKRKDNPKARNESKASTGSKVAIVIGASKAKRAAANNQVLRISPNKFLPLFRIVLILILSDVV